MLFYPTATNPALGVNKWGSGVSAAIVKKDESPWEFGAVVNNIWSLNGPPGSSDRYNQMMINPILHYHLGNGWSVGTSPEITANWLSKAGQVWTVPVGGGFAKVFHFGAQPVQLALMSYYNAIRPTASSETWFVQATVTFIFGER